jgi:hypothetical protein
VAQFAQKAHCQRQIFFFIDIRAKNDENAIHNFNAESRDSE